MQLVANKPSIPSMKLERLIKRQKQRDAKKSSYNDSDGELYIGRTQDDNNSAEFNRFATNMVAYDVTV